MLIEKLEAIRRALGLTDAEFAERLGVSRALWHLVRKGKVSGGQEMSARFLRGVVRAYPFLQPDVVFFLTADVSQVTKKDSQVTDDEPVASVAS